MKYLQYLTGLLIVMIQPEILSADTSDPYFTADSIARSYHGHSLENLKLLTDRLTLPLTTKKEKYRAIFIWVCSNVKSDYGFYKLNQLKRRKYQNHPEKLRLWNQDMNRLLFRKLVIEKQTICTGYAYLIREMSRHAGIICRIVNGIGRTENYDYNKDGSVNHSWNEVIIEDKVFLSDATWSSGMYDLQSGSFSQSIDDTFFLVSAPYHQLNYLSSENSTLKKIQAFLESPVLTRHAIKIMIMPLSPTKQKIFAKVGDTIRIHLKKPACNEYSLTLQIGNKRMTGSISSDQNGNIVIGHVFFKRGRHKISILAGNEKLIEYNAVID